jgi:sugar (pentulose or hexulose) kinase
MSQQEQQQKKKKKKKKKGYLGIDNGTQGLTVLLVDEDLQVICQGEATYGYVPGLEEGCYEQVAQDWQDALKSSMDQIRRSPTNSSNSTTGSASASTSNSGTIMDEYEVLAIGIAGQMHGQVMVDAQGHVIGTVRLWCDARNQPEADELTELFQVGHIPKRCTIARWLWTIRNQPELAKQCTFLTTPAGWLSFQLTNSKTLGIGDASGMFPMDSTTTTTNSTTTNKNYHSGLLSKFDALVNDPSIPSIASLLPHVVTCGKDAGVLSEEAAEWLGIQELAGIPVAAAEGDQPAALAGSLIGRSGMVSCSFGTSVCANLVGGGGGGGVSDTSEERSIQQSSSSSPPAVDHFCAPDGQPIYMVWLRNGTTFFNSIVESYSHGGGDFAELMPKLLKAAPDCGGLLALPFMEDEPGLQVHQGGTAMIVGWNPSNSQNPGNACKAALLSTMFNLRKGTSVLQAKGVATTELILTGGLTKTPECGQLLADVFDLSVRLLEGAEEGCSWGAAVLAKYRYYTLQDDDDDGIMDWPTFLESIPAQPTRTFQPNPKTVSVYQAMYERYQKLLALQPELQKAVSTS